LLADGQFGKAEAACRLLASQQPKHAGAAHLLGVLSLNQGLRPEGIRWLRRAVRLEAGNSYYWKDLGLAMLASLRLREASKCLQRTLSFRPDDREVAQHLGECLCQLKEYPAAVDVFGSVKGADVGLHPQIARLKTWQLDAAVKGLRRFADQHPEDPALVEAYLGLTSAFFSTGDVPGAIASANAAEKIITQRDVTSFLCRMLHYDPSAGRAAIAAQQRHFARVHCHPATTLADFTQPRASKRLRIGYVSSLFNPHAVHLKPMLEFHDRQRFEVFCFNDGRPGLHGALAWSHHVTGIDNRDMSNAQLAVCIRKRKIDILVDCDGHCAGGARLPIFAIRSAPVQFALAIYPGTTGVKNIDFRITDGWVDPPGTEKHFTEKLIRLSRFMVCNPAAARGKPTPLPAIRNRYITFGSFSIPFKMNEEVVSAWAAILHQVPRSRLLLHHMFDRQGTGTVNPAIRRRLLGMFRSLGISSSRIELTGELPPARHLRMYDRIDIALDPFPYNGTRTTCDALLRGVPVVALAGNTSAGRVGVSFLMTAGLPQHIGQNVSEYVNIAVELASERESLIALRNTLGARAKASIADGRRFTAELEEAYLRAWSGRSA